MGGTGGTFFIEGGHGPLAPRRTAPAVFDSLIMKSQALESCMMITDLRQRALYLTFY